MKAGGSSVRERRRPMNSGIAFSLTVLLFLAAAGAASAAIVDVQPIQINQAATKVTPTYTWTLEKTFTNGPDTQALTFDVASGGAASYRILATKALQRQVVTVAGTFDLRNTAAVPPGTAVPHPFQTPTLTFDAAQGGVTSQVVCNPPNSVPDGGVSTCTFTASWTDTSIMAASGGTVTVNVISNEDMSQSTSSQSYSMSANTGNAVGECATVSDAFSSGDVTEAMVTVQGSRPPSGGIQTCNLGPTEYTYTVTFQNLDATLCSRPISAINTASLRVDGSSIVQTDSATATITLTGCQGASVTVGNVRTTVINSYTWALTKTGGGSGLTTAPDQDLSVPFTITATQTLASTIGYVAGTITVQNTVSATVSISGLTVSAGGQVQATVPVSDCSTTTLTGKGASASCKFNVTDPSAPAAGSVTATVTISGGTTATSTAESYDYQTATTFNIGGTASIYDTVNEQGLNMGVTTNVATTGVAVTTTSTGKIRFEPADQRPPGTAPGLSIGGSRTFQYNMIISKMLRCTNDLTVSNIATLVPGQGSTQGSQTASASVSFRVTGCDVLPTVTVQNLQTWAAATYSWTIQKSSLTNPVQVTPGQGGTAQYQVVLTRNFQSGNYWLSGTLIVLNPANFPMYISSVTLTSTTGQFGAMPQTCLGGSNVNSANGDPNNVFTTGMPQGFVLTAGNQINCVFNVSAGTGSPPVAQVSASVTLGTGSFVGTGGNTAFSPQMGVDFNGPTQQWNIGDCVMLSDTATVTGSAGTYIPQVTGLPSQMRICNSQTVPYTAAISPVPAVGAICNTPITINNNAVAMPIGGGTTGNLQSSATTQIVVTGCQSPSPAPGPGPAPVPPPSNLPLVVTINPAVSAVSAGNYRWTVSIANDANDAVSIPYTSSKAVKYTVSAQRIAPTDGTNTVSGTITVSNPNTAAVAVSAVTASIAGTAASTAANCGSATAIPASGTITCSFTIQVTSTAPGSVTASATSDAGPSASAQPVQYSFDTTSTQGTLGKCAVITDGFTPSPILQGALTVTNNRPTDGTAIQVCDDTTYSFTAVLGPFKTTDCNLWPLGATATVTPQNGPQAQAPATAQNVLQLTVDACPGTISEDTSGVNAVVNPPTASSVVTYEWAANTVAVEYNTLVAYKDSAVISYNLTFARVPQVTSTLAGTVTVSNPTDAPVTIKTVTVMPEGAVGSMAGAIPAVTATCSQTQITPAGSTTCSYKSVSAATGGGVVMAEVQLTDGTSVSSSAQRFSFEGTATKATGADVCAEVIGGMGLGSALLLPGAAQANPAATFQVCEPGSKIFSQPVGPFKDNQCGKYMITLTSRIRPLQGSQTPFASIAPAVLQVRECPLTVTPAPSAAIGPTLTPTNVVTFSWKLSKTSNLTGDTLVVSPYDKPQAVQVTTTATRGPGRRSASIQGTVQLQAQGRSPTTVSKVQAAALSRTGELVVVDANCPAASVSNGLVNVPAPPSKLQCAFQIDNLTPMDGAVVPLVYGDRGSDTPLPADPGVWKFADAARDVQGDCATFGASASLTKKGATGADAVVQGQPVRQGANFPSTPVCRTSSTSYMLTFGPFKSTQCGSYQFDSDLSADLINSPVFETTELNFGVEVQGCKKKKKKSRLL